MGTLGNKEGEKVEVSSYRCLAGVLAKGMAANGGFK